MKRCAQCHGKLGLGVRSRILWNGRWWVHVRYCSAHCEARHELERRERQISLLWFLKPIPPKGLNLNVPMSDAFKKVIASPTDSGDPAVY